MTIFQELVKSIPDSLTTMNFAVNPLGVSKVFINPKRTENFLNPLRASDAGSPPTGSNNTAFLSQTIEPEVGSWSSQPGKTTPSKKKSLSKAVIDLQQSKVGMTRNSFIMQIHYCLLRAALTDRAVPSRSKQQGFTNQNLDTIEQSWHITVQAAPMVWNGRNFLYPKWWWRLMLVHVNT